MHELPSGGELLAIARRVLHDKLIAELPAEHRHQASLVADAMAIAARQLDRGDEPEHAELQRLSAVFGVTPREEAWKEQLLDLNRKLARQIRSGELDAASPKRKAVLEHLLAAARENVRVSNPAYLEPQEP